MLGVARSKQRKGESYGPQSVIKLFKLFRCWIKVTTSTSNLSTPETGECHIASLGWYSPGGSGFWQVASLKKIKHIIFSFLTSLSIADLTTFVCLTSCDLYGLHSTCLHVTLVYLPFNLYNPCNTQLRWNRLIAPYLDGLQLNATGFSIYFKGE